MKPVVQARLMLGSAQFGMAYGIANQAGLPDAASVAAILDRADSRSIDAVDTAIDYDLAEQRLGAWPGLRRWQVVTKLPPLPEQGVDVGHWVADQVHASLARLGIGQLHGLLLHRPMQLLEDHRGAELWAAMAELQESGQVRRIGYSVYSPQQLDQLWTRFPAQLVQAPFSVIDRRLLSSGWLARLARAGVEVHVRSVFLQGLLLMPRSAIPAVFGRWQGLWEGWHDWLHQARTGPVAAALGYVLRQPGIDRVVVGVDSTAQLDQIMTASTANIPRPPATLASNDIDLLHPDRWPRSAPVPSADKVLP